MAAESARELLSLKWMMIRFLGIKKKINLEIKVCGYE